MSGAFLPSMDCIYLAMRAVGASETHLLDRGLHQHVSRTTDDFLEAALDGEIRTSPMRVFATGTTALVMLANASRGPSSTLPVSGIDRRRHYARALVEAWCVELGFDPSYATTIAARAASAAQSHVFDSDLAFEPVQLLGLPGEPIVHVRNTVLASIGQA